MRSSRQSHSSAPGIHSLQAGESVSTTRKPRRPSSANAVDLPVPDMPVTRTLATSGQ